MKVKERVRKEKACCNNEFKKNHNIQHAIQFLPVERSGVMPFRRV